MFAPGRILQFGGNSNGALVIDINGPLHRHPDAIDVDAAQLGQRHRAADGKVLATGGSQMRERADRRQQHGRDLEPGDWHLDVGARAA